MRGVSKRFGATVALSNVDLEVRPGEVHALLGENGAGKSTLMKILSGALAPDSGTLELDGERYSPSSPLDGRRAGVAMIYQELSIAPHLSVAENVLLGVEPTRGLRVLWGPLRDRARDALARVGRADIDLDQPAGRLTIADQQLVEIARSIALGARVVVLDEPTSSLAQEDVERLFRLIGELRDRGTSVVYISHFLEEVRAVTDRYTVLRDGESVGAGVTAEATPEELVAQMVGREVAELYPRSPRQPGAPALVLDRFGGRAHPDAVDLQLHRGEVVGLAGLVGAGRTELLRAIFGLDPVVRGDVRMAHVTGPSSPGNRWRQGVGMVSEDRKREGLALGLSIADNLTLARQRTLLSPRALAAESQPWIEKLGVRCRDAEQTIGSLSGGNQQKVAIARLLHADVDVLLLDEPTRGIDVGSRAEIYRVIDELARAGRAILLVSSYLPELLGTCDRIAVMCRGRLGPARPVADVDEHSILLEATGAREATA
ncbi:MAG: sugar ABC transporter ATP-binding protein [Planctomycetota bacterium]|nr:sugar ABC transporter ATP-binding protein [Planctomycetota bacterium]MDA0934898.1 sugar ABC transporter ATP-binding protein [Planctomycetota bacterium]MDA1222274.1 sugar ABC transporter ATP-binding protein [Planctomycetota bacterium]